MIDGQGRLPEAVNQRSAAQVPSHSSSIFRLAFRLVIDHHPISAGAAARLFPYSKGNGVENIERSKRKLFAEIFADHDTVAIAKLDVDDRGVLIYPILVGSVGT